jgi:hypothetical protein
MNKHEIEKQLLEASESSNKSCGLNYEIYEDRLFNHIDSLIVSSCHDDQILILSVAKNKYDYKPESERILEDDSWKDDLCSHFFDPHCCPLGCGDLE